MYLDCRTSNGKTAKVRANRERALLSAIWNYARDRGYTAKANPCAGIRGWKEEGRKKIYVTDTDFAAICKTADQPTRDALELAYLTGRRPTDVLTLDETQIRDETMWIRQRKTGALVGISIEGQLKTVIDRIKEPKRALPVVALSLVVNEEGQRLTYPAFRKGFDKARKKAGVEKAEFQYRDLRAKAGTDKRIESGVDESQRLLGHASVVMTEHYVRERKTRVVKPTK